MFKTYTAPQVGATSIDDEGSTWRVTSVEGAHINWKLFKESKLTKEIDFKIQPEFTGWRDKLLYFIPRVLESKIDTSWFYRPLIKFIKKHKLSDLRGRFHLNPYTKDEARLRLLYRLWLVYKMRLRVYRMHTSRMHSETDIGALLDTAKKSTEISLRENAHLKRRLEELEKETESHSRIYIPEQRPNVVFDSDSEED